MTTNSILIDNSWTETRGETINISARDILSNLTSPNYSLGFPNPKLIRTLGNKTFVEWSDGTKTKVKCEYGRKPDPFSAFCAAFAKRMFGSTSKVLDAIKNADEKELKQREHEANRLKHEERLKKEKERFEKDVAKKRYELAVMRKAEKLLEQENADHV